MRNTITLNGIKSSDIAGLLIQSLPPISKPLMRTEIEEIDGRDGDIVTNLGFSAYDKEIIIGLYGDFDINQVIAYFNSEGVVVFSNEPDKYYNYQIINQIDFDRLLRYRTATVTMHCQPFKYSTTETPVTLGSNPPTTVSGEGNDIVLQNTSEAPFDQLDLKGDTTQQTYTGKNIMPVKPSTASNYGVTVTATPDGKITVNGTTTTGVLIKVTNNVGISIGDNIDPTWFQESIVNNLNGKTISIRYVSGTYGSSGIAWRLFKDTSPYLYQWYPNNSVAEQSFASDTVATTFFALYAQSGKTFDHYTVQIQLESGAESTNFEPYVGGVASPNPDYPQDVNVVTGGQLVKVTGKNLFDKDLPLSNMYIDANGSWISASDPYYINQEYAMSGGSQLAFSFSQRVGSAYARIAEFDSNGAFIKRTLISTESVLTLDSNTAKVIFSIDSNTAIRFDNLQIEKGSAATKYEPYQKQSYEINLGKNLFDKNNPNILNAYIDGEHTAITSNDKNRIIWIPCKPNQTYTIQKIATNMQKQVAYTTIEPAIGVTVYSMASWAANTSSKTYTTGADAKYLVVRIYQSDNDAAYTLDQILASVQIEQGSTATSYASYFEPIELCKMGDYQDYFYKDGDDWYLHKEIKKTTFTSVNLQQYTNNTYNKFSRPEDAIAGYTEVVTATSNMGEGKWKNQTWDSALVGLFTHASQSNWWLGFGGVKTTEEVTNIMAQGCIVYYALATPTNTKITNTDLIEQLEAVSNAHSWNPITYITATSDGTNLPIIIAATAAGNMDGTITNSGNTTARPKLTIYGSGDISIYLNGVQLFQIALGTEGYITIDTNAMEAYKDTTDNLKNRLVIGDYSNFVLKPGANQIGFSGNTTMCVVENYSRWL